MHEFAEAYGLHLFTKDEVVFNRAIAFKIETFEPTESFNPSKPYKTRLKWSDATGAEQSKLLATEPETVIAEVVQAEADAEPSKSTARRPVRGRKGSSRMEVYHA